MGYVIMGLMGYVLGKGCIVLPKKMTVEEKKIELKEREQRVERRKLEDVAQGILLQYDGGE